MAYATAKGLEAYRIYLQRLEKDIRDKEKELGQAADEGNTWHDNAPWEALRDEVQLLDRRFAEKRGALTDIVIEPYPKNPETIGYGTGVEFKRDGRSQDYKFVGLGHIDLDSDQLWYLSPLGTALSGHKEGDIFDAEVAGRLAEFNILKVYALDENKLTTTGPEGD